MDNLLTFFSLGIIIVIIVLVVRRTNRHERQINDFLAEARRTKPLFHGGSAWGKIHFQLARIGADETRRQRCLLVVSNKHLAIYVREDDTIQRVFAAVPADLRWFGRPEKYRYGTNEIWLHYQIGASWHLLKLDMYITQMQRLVRALKAIASDNLVTAYRRRRPYIHHGPVAASPVTQDIHGAWTLAAPVSLYVMPTKLVIFEEGDVVQTYPVREITAVERVRRTDILKRGGLVRFTALGDNLAYALDDDKVFAYQLSSASKADLEEITRKRKNAVGG